ncbi:MAG: [Fe-Fe] hydrogenase large subunit C-terminal domain-containing protein [Candidatus Eisenbacteria bacterium]
MGKYYHPIQFVGERCGGRMKCMRSCPTAAIRMRDGKARMIEELCVDCGECINVCPSGAIVPLTDPFTRSLDFKYKVALPSPVLYSQFRPEVDPRRIITGLKRIGFDYVCDVSRACREVSIAIDESIAQHRGRLPVVSSFCPAVVRLIQVKYPDLTGRVVPVDVPREIAARDFKQNLSHELGVDIGELGVVYITTCPAKIVSIKQPAEKEKSWIDGAVSIVDVFAPLFSAVADLEDDEIDEDVARDFTFGAGWSMLGEMTRLIGAEHSIAASGMSDVTKILDDIENSKLRDVEFVELSSCLGGCIGGSLVVENMYVARSSTLNLLRKYGGKVEVDRDEVIEKYNRGHYSLEKKLAPRPLRPLDGNLARAIEKKKRKDTIYNALPKIDCGCCGAPTCIAFADDIVRGDGHIEDCIYMGGIKDGKRRSKDEEG